MIYTVVYSRKNNFMVERDPRIITRDNEGLLVGDKKYVKPTLPKVTKTYRPAQSYKTRHYVVDLNEKELNTLVEQIGFYDPQTNNKITKASIKNPGDPFWRHPELQIVLSADGTTLDDENAIDNFWISCFRADPRFKFRGDNIAPSAASRVEFTVTTIKDSIAGEEEDADEAFEAMGLLVSMQDDYEKMAAILTAMGVRVTGSNSKTCRQTLNKLITTNKDVYVTGTNERNIEFFIRQAKANVKDLSIEAYVAKARQNNIIQKKGTGAYVFGDLPIGKTLQEIYAYIENPENDEVREAIFERVDAIK